MADVGVWGKGDGVHRTGAETQVQVWGGCKGLQTSVGVGRCRCVAVSRAGCRDTSEGAKSGTGMLGLRCSD